MFDNRIIGALGIASALALGVATQASASPLLGIELMQSGYATFSTTGITDPLFVSQSFGTFTTNFEVNNLVTDPLSMDLGSLNVSSSTGGTLTIIASATGLDTPAFSGFISQFSGNFTGAVSSVTLQTYLSGSNTMFGTDTLLSSLTGTGGSFGSTVGNNATATGPFALTEVMTITTTGRANLSLDGSIASAPEIDAGSGAAAIALLLGALGLVGERRRRPEAIA
jgi:hypothetical protein